MKRNFVKIFSILATIAIAFVSCAKIEKGNNNDNGNNGGNDDEEIIDENLPASLKGKAYVPIFVDGETAKIIKKRQVSSLTIDDNSHFLYYWDRTYKAGESEGLNFYGNADGFLTLLTTGIGGWSGAGFCRPVDKGYVKSFIDMNEIDDWYFHLAYKPETEKEAHCIIIYWGANGIQQHKFSIGFGVQDGAALIRPVNNDGVCTVGKWNEYEIPLSKVGIDYGVPGNGNYLVVMSGGVANTQLNLDALFYYKKK